jgi:hypothetical protein
MQANDLAYEYLDILDKKTSNSSPGFTDEEISRSLSLAQEEYIKRKYNWRGNPYNQGFENSEKRKKDLAQLVTSAVVSYSSVAGAYTISLQGGESYTIEDDNSFFRDSSIINPNGTLWKLPKDFLWAIKEEVSWNTQDECYVGKRYSVKPITHDEYNQWIDNSFKQPWFKETWRMDHSSEYNANTEVAVTTTNTRRWYRVTSPEAVDNTTQYDLVVNGNTYSFTTDGTATRVELINGLVAELEGNEEYRISSDQFTVYVLSDSEVTTNSGSTTNDLILSVTYLPLPEQLDNDQMIIGTDYQVHELITDGSMEIGNYYLRYLRKPRNIVVDTVNPLNQVHCELNESTHREIIEMAVTKTLSSLQDPRIQTQMIEEQQSE